MLKFLRRYQKWILAIGGSLLMVAFLLPQALQRWGENMFRRIEATYVLNDRTYKVSNAEWQRTIIEFAILHEGFPGELDRLLNPKGLPKDDPDYLEVVNASHWFLLTLAAREAGLTSTASEGEATLRTYAAQWLQQNPDLLGNLDRVYDMIMDAPRRAVSGRMGQDRDIHRAYANYLAVGRLISLYQTAGVEPDWRLKELLERFERTLHTSMVFLEADKFTADLETPNEEETQSHFEEFKATAPGEGPYGIGYLQPDRVKIEYLVIDYNSIYDAISVTGKDARKWYSQNKDNREMFPLAPNQTEAPPYEEVMDDVITAYRHLQTEQQAREVINFVKAQLLRATQGLKRDGDYRILPDDWAQRRLSFESLRDEIIAKFGCAVRYHAEADRWLALDELARQPSLGSAIRKLGTRDVSIQELVGSIREFDNVTITGLQVGLTDPEPLRVRTWERNVKIGRTQEALRDILFYRVLDADPERPARDVDEVRDELVANVKRIKAFNALSDSIDAWKEKAVTLGLDAVAEELRVQATPLAVRRYDRTVLDRFGWVPTTMGLADRSDVLAEQIYDRAKDWDPLVPADEHDMADRVIVCPIPTKLCVAIVRIDSIQPMTREAWRQIISRWRYTFRSTVSDLIAGSERQYRAPTPFSYDDLLARYQFTVKSSSRDEEPEEGMGGVAGDDESGDVGESGAEDDGPTG